MKNKYFTQAVCFLGMLLALAVFSPLQAQEMNNANSSLVIVKIDNLTGQQLNGIAKEAGKTANISFEYSCRESNVVVLKYYHSLTEEADVETSIKSKLVQWAGNNKVIVLFVDVQKAGDTKC